MHTHKSYESEAALWKYSVYRAVTLSVNLWCSNWFTVLLFAVCNGFSVTFEHPASNCYDIKVHYTSSAYFILSDLQHILTSLGFHFVCNEILTCSKILPHKMVTEYCFISQLMGSILTSHSMAFPSGNIIPWEKVIVITDTKKIHFTSHAILLTLYKGSSPILVLLNKDFCHVMCRENVIWLIQFSEVMALFDMKWNIINTDTWRSTSHLMAQDCHKCDRLSPK
jgi:hypothetical protein